MKSKAAARTTGSMSKLVSTPIAIVGMASVFPGARTTPEYWDNILRKIDSVTDVPESRWSVADYYDPNPAAPDKTYCKRGGFIPDVEFDPVEFGLPPNILEVTDVSQLLSLVIAKEAMLDAGYDVSGTDPERDFDREHTGVVLGVVGISAKLLNPLMSRLQYPVWRKAMLSSGMTEQDADKIIEKIKTAYVGWEENAFPGTIVNVIAGRIANRFDLGATNCVVDAACGSSLAAVRMAIGELIEGRANMMITGGVDTDNSIGTYLCFSKTPAFSKGQNVRTFDAESDGMMVGEGIGMLVLKRLADAERDGDRIYAVIRGLGSSSDGRYKSIYAPRPTGQARALRRAYEEAGFPASTVGLMEAHGTGTPAGDPAEAESMREVFGENNPRRGYIALGSIKSQIAHTKAAAGAASLIKTALALHHKVLPATINVKKVNPRLGLDESPFYVNTENRPWIRGAHPRRAGVSSFGFGGTNFHVALEEYTAEHQAPYRVQTVPQPLFLHGETPAALTDAARNQLAALQGPSGPAAFAEWTRTSAAVVIPQGHARLGFVAETLAEAVELLQLGISSLAEKSAVPAWEHPRGVFYRAAGLDPKGKVAALFAGQGSQTVNMGRELALNFPEIRTAYARIDELFAAEQLPTVSEVVFPAPVQDPAAVEKQTEALTRTEYAQPAIGTLSVGQYKLLQQAGFQADFTAGHSFGELTALWAAGVLSDETYNSLAKARGKAMAPPADPNFDAGTMLAVKGDLEKLQEALKAHPEVTLANFNSNQQFVLAGSRPAIAAVQKTLTEAGFSAVPLQVSAAFHTPLVAHAHKPFARAIEAAQFNPPAVPVFSNSTAQPHSADPKQIKKTLASHILQPVLYRDEIEAMYAAGCRIFVEFGPKNIQANLVKSILADRDHVVVAMNPNPKKDSDRQLREAYVQLVVTGLQLRNLDPYVLPAPVQNAGKKKSPATVLLNGGFYVTEKTRSGWQKSLTDGYKVQGAGSATPASTLPPANGSGSNGNGSAPKTQPIPAAPVLQPAAAAASPAPLNEKALEQFYSLQSDSMRIHEQYLKNQSEYARSFADLVRMGYNLFSTGQVSGEALRVLESIERSLNRFHEQQSETLKLHEQYLSSQSEFSRSVMSLISALPAASPVSVQAAPAQSAAAPQVSVPLTQPVSAPPVQAAPAQTASQPQVVVSAPVPAAASAEQISNSLLEVVSEKTGYPAEMIDLNMDMEADLGIDSIKRVEILGAMQNRYPDLPKIDPADLTEVRTLGQVLSRLSEAVPSAPVPAAVSLPLETAPAARPVPQPSSASALDVKTLTAAMLEIVSEKTGYPTEMLDLAMDMEADLGIDSIKRVEILGAMQARFPELPKIDASALSETRTLGQITELMSSQAPAPALAPFQEPVSVAAETPLPAAPASADLDPELISRSLLEVVSEKTGYPAEMIDLNMDMEADLGIDSIKRVEILGAIQSKFPSLPKLEASLLTELRTLKQIIDALGSTFQGGLTPAVEAPRPFDLAGQAPALQDDQPAPANLTGLPTGALSVRDLPRPDALDYNLPGGPLLLLSGGATPLAALLAGALEKRGWKVVQAGPQSALAALPAGAASQVVDTPDEDCLRGVLDQVTKRYGAPAGLIYLHPDSTGAELFDQQSEAWLKGIFLLARQLKEPLAQAAKAGRALFLTVTRLDGQFGLAHPAGLDLPAAGLSGLVKTLAQEWETVHCRALDLAPDLESDQAIAAVLSEIDDPDRTVWEIGYTRAGRCMLVAE